MMLVLVFVLDTVNQETFVIGIFSSLPTMTKIKNMKIFHSLITRAANLSLTAMCKR